MQYIYLIAVAAVAVSSRSIGLRSSIESTSPPPLHSSIDSQPSTPQRASQCHFTPPQHRPITLSAPASFIKPNDPQAPLQSIPNSGSSNPSSRIPGSAWTHIATLLMKYMEEKQNTMQTLDLGRILNDEGLEGVMLGIVYSSAVGEGREGREGLRVKRDNSIPESWRWRRECVLSAVHEVENSKQMEGVLDIAADEKGEGGGKVSFLVYRVD